MTVQPLRFFLKPRNLEHRRHPSGDLAPSTHSWATTELNIDWTELPSDVTMPIQTAAMRTPMMLYSVIVAPSSLQQKNFLTALNSFIESYPFASQGDTREPGFGRAPSGSLDPSAHSAPTTALKALETEFPSVPTMAIETAAMRATMMPYSVIVAPSSWRPKKNLRMLNSFIQVTPFVGSHGHRGAGIGRPLCALDSVSHMAPTTLLNALETEFPSVPTMAIETAAMRATMMPYSVIVAPSSLTPKNFLTATNSFDMSCSLLQQIREPNISSQTRSQG